MKLDGSDEIKLVPFDAHEQVVRQHHEHSKDGYQAKEYKHQEYPKAIAHDPETGDPVIAKDAEHEEELESQSRKGKKGK